MDEVVHHDISAKGVDTDLVFLFHVQQVQNKPSRAGRVDADYFQLSSVLTPRNCAQPHGLK